MAKLSTAQRKNLPKSSFALPSKKGSSKNKAGRGAFPINDKVHAEKALQLAPRSRKAGNITASEERTIQRKAKAKLGETPNVSRSAKLKGRVQDAIRRWK